MMFFLIFSFCTRFHLVYLHKYDFYLVYLSMRLSSRNRKKTPNEPLLSLSHFGHLSFLVSSVTFTRCACSVTRTAHLSRRWNITVVRTMLWWWHCLATGSHPCTPVNRFDELVRMTIRFSWADSTEQLQLNRALRANPQLGTESGEPITHREHTTLRSIRTVAKGYLFIVSYLYNDSSVQFKFFARFSHTWGPRGGITHFEIYTGWVTNETKSRHFENNNTK